jgi:glutamate racemase
MKIVVFDSGLGSLSIIKAIQKKTKSDIIYLADKKNFPYGKKTKSQLYKIITQTIKKISEKFNPDVIVLASNTPSLLFKDELPKNIITVLPPLEKVQKASNVAILATQVVVESKELENCNTI